MMDQMISSTFENVRQQVDRVRSAMQEGMRTDPRFRALVDSCTAFAREECGPIDPDRADWGAHEQAQFAAALMLARVYDTDGELAAMRAERDRYKKLAEDAFMSSPMPVFIRTTPTA